MGGTVFKTHETAKVNIPVGLIDPDESVWNYVFTRLNTHWFPVVTRSTHEEDGYRELRNFFMAHPEKIQVLKDSRHWEIAEVSLVSPAHMNGSDHWQMEPLIEIIKGQESTLEHEQYGYVFVLKNGNRYIRSLNRNESELRDLYSIYRSDSNLNSD